MSEETATTEEAAETTVTTEAAETTTESTATETTETKSILNADEEKAAEAAEETPIEYEPFAMPEGLTLDENLAGVFKPVFADMKLNQEQAQKLVDLYSTEVVQKQIEGWNQTLEGWDTEVKADKEIGGAKYDESLKVAARAFKSFEVPEAADILAQYGLHRHPAIIKLFARVGGKMAEPTEIIGGGNPVAKLDALYPTMKK